ncbi:O-antigen ligase [Pseudomonas sp. MN1F]|uniref:O-antigen ligase family protein n=1 Tax=Pseudomonas sp. MN1F TaxID=1366632 RepID=UPI00273EBFCF|nr:O-antigen ligase family protein [Pseudomonas sp. MN1F]
MAPSNKLYQQGMILFMWLPALLMAWSARRILLEAWQRQPALWGALVLFLLWGALSLAWSSNEEVARESKRLIYILLFLLAFPLIGQMGPSRIRLLLRIGAGLLAIAALVSIVRFYGVLAMPLITRLEGIGEISHPILGAYVVGVAALLLLYDLPKQRALRLGWLLALACLSAFVALSQSRGAAVALVIPVIMAPLWFRDRHSQLMALFAVVSTGLAFYAVYDLIAARGSSFRPEIFRSALHMIGEHPWGGLGLGGHYKVEAAGLQFDHTHNMFTHVAVEFGVPGMLLWIAVWLFALGEIVRARDTVFGKILLCLWIYSTMAMQFDAASLTATPRAEWFVSWLPVGLVMLLPWMRAENDACGKICGST